MKISTKRSSYSYGSNAYLLESGGEYALIDPSITPDEADFDLSKLKYVIITHTHFDHIIFVDRWVNETGARLLLGLNDEMGLSDPEINCYKRVLGMDKGFLLPFTTLKEGDNVSLGEEKISVLETPGHTKGSISLVVDGSIFVGDVLFANRAYGRYDLPGGDFRRLMDSIKKILSLPTEYKIYPGHGPETTVDKLKNNN